MAEKVDARGLSCPQPVILTRRALQGAGAEAAGLVDEIVVLVDTMTQVHNCTRAAEKLGWSVACEETEDAFELTLRRAKSLP
jgi:TusA-related sulfurtransferase